MRLPGAPSRSAHRARAPLRFDIRGSSRARPRCSADSRGGLFGCITPTTFCRAPRGRGHQTPAVLPRRAPGHGVRGRSASGGRTRLLNVGSASGSRQVSAFSVATRPSDRFVHGWSWRAGRVVAETAQHAGHADILREASDGRTSKGRRSRNGATRRRTAGPEPSPPRAVRLSRAPRTGHPTRPGTSRPWRHRRRRP